MILVMFSMNTKKKVQNFCDYRTIVFQLLSHGLTLLRPHGLQSTRLLCPWDSPGKNTGVGCHVLLQGIFQTQGLNSCLLHWQVDSLMLSHQGSLCRTINLFQLEIFLSHFHSELHQFFFFLFFLFFFYYFIIFYFFIFFKFYFIFKLYIIVLVLPNIKMNPPQVYIKNRKSFLHSYLL